MALTPCGGRVTCHHSAFPPTRRPPHSQPPPGRACPASPLSLAAPLHAVSRHPVRRGSRSPGARSGRLAPRQCACESPDLPLSRQVVEGLTAAGRALLPSPASVTASAVGSSPASQRSGGRHPRHGRSRQEPRAPRPAPHPGSLKRKGGAVERECVFPLKESFERMFKVFLVYVFILH